MTTGAMASNCPMKRMINWIGTKKIAFCSCYNATPTLVQNLQNTETVTKLQLLVFNERASLYNVNVKLNDTFVLRNICMKYEKKI